MLGGDFSVGMYRKAMSVGKRGKSMKVGELARCGKDDWRNIASITLRTVRSNGNVQGMSPL
jgi:hypothetical protein